MVRLNNYHIKNEIKPLSDSKLKTRMDQVLRNYRLCDDRV